LHFCASSIYGEIISRLAKAGSNISSIRGKNEGSAAHKWRHRGSSGGISKSSMKMAA